MRIDVANNFSLAEGYKPHIRRILKENAGYFLEFEDASEDTDMKEATDILINIRGASIAVRVRKDTRYRDLTIRSECGGYKTEIDKIKEGFGRWYLYLWVNDNEKTVNDWMIIDLNKLRECGILEEVKTSIMNRDGRTGFKFYKAKSLFEKDCIVKASFDLLA